MAPFLNIKPSLFGTTQLYQKPGKKANPNYEENRNPQKGAVHANDKILKGMIACTFLTGTFFPRNDLEEKLAGIWAEILGIEKDIISMDSNFFELGGQSLKAVIMVTKIHKELNCVIALAEIFKAPTIEGIASLIGIINWVENKDNETIAHFQQREEIELMSKKRSS